MRLLLFVFLGLMAAFLAAALSLQVDTVSLREVTVQGRVVDSQTGESIGGATVVVGRRGKDLASVRWRNNLLREREERPDWCSLDGGTDLTAADGNFNITYTAMLSRRSSLWERLMTDADRSSTVVFCGYYAEHPSYQSSLEVERGAKLPVCWEEHTLEAGTRMVTLGPIALRRLDGAR